MNLNALLTIFLSVLLLLAASPVYAKKNLRSEGTDISVINKKMDDFHDAADKGDNARYLNHFAKDGVFMGTDDWERRPFPAFLEYVNKHFKDGKGWSYKPVKRYTSLNKAKNVAWLDEILESKKWGRFRGTAVLEKVGRVWKLKHYSLSVLVPNETWEEVNSVTKKAFTARDIEAGLEPVVID